MHPWGHWLPGRAFEIMELIPSYPERRIGGAHTRKCVTPRAAATFYPKFKTVLQVPSRVGIFLRAAACCVAVCGFARAADPEVVPVGVCEVLRNLVGWENKEAAIVGRYSFRLTGRWVSEQICDPVAADPPQLWIVEDEKDGPRLPDRFELSATAVHSKLAGIERRTALAKFPFGTRDYDRWAVIYGRIEARKGDDARKAPANLVIRGTAVIVFLAE